MSFVSPDGTESLTLQRYASVPEVIDGLTVAGLGVETVELEPLQPTPETRELVYRTEQGALAPDHLAAADPGPDGVWTVRLTVPSGPSEDAAAALFEALADGFIAA